MSLKTGQTTLPQMIDEINRVAGKADSALNSDSIVQGVGQNTNKIMSQKAVTDALAEIGASGAIIETTETDCNNLPVVEGTFYNPNGFGQNIPAADPSMGVLIVSIKYITQKLASFGSSMFVALQEGVSFPGAVATVKFVRYFIPPSSWGDWTLLPQSVVQTTGQSTFQVMSQKAVTDAIPILFSKTGPSSSGGMTQKAITDELALKADLTAVLLKNGPDLVVGQTLSALISGKSYLDCAITATVSSGTYYFYNCTGTVTVSGTTAKVYAVNCPNLTINGKTTSNWQNIWEDGVSTYRSGSDLREGGSIIMRFLDGVQILTGVVSQYAEDAPVAKDYTFPYSFYDLGYTITGNTIVGGSDYQVVLSFWPLTNSTFRIGYALPTGSGPYRNRVQYTAIGRWKA